MDKKKQLQDGLKGGKLSFTFDPRAPGASYLSEAIEPKRKPGRPKTSPKVITQGNTPEDGTKEGERRITYILKREVIDKIDSIAYWERRMIKEIVGEALQDYLTRYEKKNGPIKPKK